MTQYVLPYPSVLYRDLLLRLDGVGIYGAVLGIVRNGKGSCKEFV